MPSEKSPLRYDVAERRPTYSGQRDAYPLDRDRVTTFNQRHKEVLGAYGLELADGNVFVLDGRCNGRSNLGVFRSKQLRQAVVLAAALPAAAVVLDDGRGSYERLPDEDRAQKKIVNRLKRQNDRTSAQVMGEVLQRTTETFEVGEEVIIQSAATEGVRAKPGLEAGGNPTIPVGALYGKEHHCRRYAHGLSSEVSRLSMGSDVIDGTTKSVKGLHSSITALFVSESGFKRHLPDIYVERWMAGAPFPEFNPRDTDVVEEADIIAKACDLDFEQLAAFFIERARHSLPMDQLNALGIATPYDRDGDLFPAIVMGLEGLRFPDGRGLTSMIGEIGGSAEWAVGALPLVWRGGQSLGMLTSQNALTRKDLTPEQLWAERFHYTEDELILLQDARFEQKPFFTVRDVMERPFAGGVSAFSAITDNCFLPDLEGVSLDPSTGRITTHTLVINSLGTVEHWELVFRAVEGLDATRARMRSPKVALRGLAGRDLVAQVGAMAQDEASRMRLKQFFVNEYYPAIIHTDGRIVVLERTVEALIGRGALSEHDRAIVAAVVEAVPEWFVSAA